MDALSVLQRLSQGRLLEELHEALVKTAEEVVATGKPGVVTLRLTVGGSQGNPMVAIAEALSRTAPKKESRGAFFFALNGELFREDPRQTRLDFRTVDTSTGEIIDTHQTERNERSI
ncbi:MAG: hypothetical protein A2Y38_18185 [Spirochaetes bacterium GWB1_59_5]|nr:MAG: hypothetical protein A2Y38_18185 [Spirochaetes bacterium GWB1_59_5]